MGEQDSKPVRIFDYVPDLDVFETTRDYDCIAKVLNLYEWNSVVWIGRFFALDNDYGEHWFDNWDEREELTEKIIKKNLEGPLKTEFSKEDDEKSDAELTYTAADKILEEKYSIGHEGLLIVNPSRFEPKTRPACHSPEQRKRFWTDVLKSLQLSLETISDEAIRSYGHREELHDIDSNFPFEEMNIEKRIEKIKSKFKQENAKPDKQMIKIFDYDHEIDAFTASEEYKELAFALKLYEDGRGEFNKGNPVRWMGRLFTMDDDYGEICFDNWQDREYIKAYTGYDKEKLKEFYTINPDKLADGDDGPCHNSAHRKKFWTDVLKSMHLSLDTLFEEARAKYSRELELAKKDKTAFPFEGHLHGKEFFDLEKKIEEIKGIYS